MLTGYHIGHLSDTHLGYEAYRARNAGGENQRAADFARAFVTAAKDIIASDPALVIHSGDVADRPHIPIRFMVLIQHWFEKMSGIRPDGTRRQVVVVGGNHELPRDRREACFLDLFRGMPGVHVVTQGYKTIEFSGTGKSENCDPALKDTIVHCLPHDALKETDFELVAPEPDKVNILSSHGVAGGSELYIRSLGREFAIPSDVLLRKWDYGALGHWHKQGPIPLLGATGLTKKEREARKSQDLMGTTDVLVPDETAETGRIWYAGSTENSGFGDLRDNGSQRGWLSVQIRPGDLPLVTRKNLPIRAMFRLPHLDATGMTPDDIVKALKENLTKAEITGAVIGQVVSGVSRELWSLVDMASVRAAAGGALHYDPEVRYIGSAKNQDTEERGLGDISAVLSERAKEILNADEVEPALLLAKKLLSVAMDATAAGSTKDSISMHEEKNEKETTPTEVKEAPADDSNAKEDY